MNAFVAQITAVDPLLKPTPEDADSRIVQPTGLIKRFCFILRKTSGGNNVYHCKIYSHVFMGSKVIAATHFEKKLSAQQLTQCKGPIPLQLQDAIGIKLAEKIAADDDSKKKRVYADLTSPDQSSLVRSFATQASPIADSAILRFIVSQGLAPSLVNDEGKKKYVDRCSCYANQLCSTDKPFSGYQ
jgi:hypothetical protein